MADSAVIGLIKTANATKFDPPEKRAQACRRILPRADIKIQYAA